MDATSLARIIGVYLRGRDDIAEAWVLTPGTDGTSLEVTTQDGTTYTVTVALEEG